ncbi:MAG: OmpA family protein [Azonexus sp.]|uniref:OmpA family protein n=1 Tax=Azonexus sp. TaxID=1872668 RepID=UPI00283641B3|nr:OmpA family protein [Azonexus sp.]MDR0775825.1 OmpA family protein [Azonexus sp.]
MKMFPRLLLLFSVLALQACSTSQPPRAAAVEALPAVTARAPVLALSTQIDRLPAPTPVARADEPAPDAVIKVEPGSTMLTPEMRARLAEIARLAKEDERSQLRLEGYVPDGGSSAWNIGAAEKSLQLVREYLESLRVPARRIQLAAFGGEHGRQRDDHRHWVEVYLLRSRR